MADVKRSLNEATSFVKKYKNTFKSQNVRSHMNTTDAEHTVKLQLKRFQKEYDTIKKGNKRIEKTTDARVKGEYIRRQECDYRVLARKIQSWFEHYKKDVIYAIDIVINTHMLNRDKRPFRCRPPVCDSFSRYYFGRTVCEGKMLAIRANYEGSFLIQGWLFYHPDTGADVELFKDFLPYTEDNVATFMTDIVLFDHEASRTPDTLQPASTETTTETTYENNVMPTTLVVYEPSKDELKEELSEEAEFPLYQEEEQTNEPSLQPDDTMDKHGLVEDEDDENDDDDDDDESDDDEDDDEDDESDDESEDDDDDDESDDDDDDESDDNDDESEDDDDEDDDVAKPAEKVANPTWPDTRHLTFEQKHGFYVHTKGLEEYLAKHFTHASLNVHTLIKSRYSRRTRLYALKEPAYKKLVIGTLPAEPSPKDQCDLLRKILLGLWKTKAFIRTPDEMAKMKASSCGEYVHVLDGVL